MHITRRHAVLAAGALAASLLTPACEGEGADDPVEPETPGDDAATTDEPGVPEEPETPEEPDAPQALTPEEAVAALTLEQRVAQLFVVAPEALTGVSVQVAAGEATRDALRARPVGGLVLFAANLVDPDQTREMLANARAYALEATGIPCLLAVDEEGGTVARVGSNPAFGVERVGDMASVGSVADARDAALTIGSYLANLGFNLDFAPDADIASQEGSSLARRSFGSDAETVAPRVAAQVEAFLSTGILCCAKHFPGIGGVVGDSHDGTITSHRTLDEMGGFELLPFEAAIAEGVPLVMVGHLSCPEVTGDDTPASLSPVVVGDVLRGRLGFEGVVITDSLAMGAVAELCAPSEIGVRALEAGVDLILMPSDFEAAYQGVLDAVRSGRLSEERIEESVTRVVSMKLAHLA